MQTAKINTEREFCGENGYIIKIWRKNIEKPRPFWYNAGEVRWMKDSFKGAFDGAEFNKTADICEGNGIFGGSAKVINLGEVAACLTGAQREKFVSGFNMKEFARIFEDESMMTTAETFLSCGLNVSLAARRLYMHRNTLIYRLNSLKRKTGLDLRDFDMAVTFEILHKMYLIK